MSVKAGEPKPSSPADNRRCPVDNPHGSMPTAGGGTVCERSLVWNEDIREIS